MRLSLAGRILGIAGVAILGICGTLTAAAAQPNTPAAAQPRKFDYRRIQALREFSPSERASRGIGFFREEIANPSSTTQGVDLRDEIGHFEILANVAGILAEVKPDPQVLMTELARSKGELAVAIVLALGGLAEPSVLPQLGQIFGDARYHKAWRLSAGRALLRQPDARAAGIAARVLATDLAAWRTDKRDPQTNERLYEIDAYLLRRQALELLKAIDDRGLATLGPDVRAVMSNPLLERRVDGK